MSSLSKSIIPLATTAGVAGAGVPGANASFFATPGPSPSMPPRGLGVGVTIATSAPCNLFAMIGALPALALGPVAANKLTTFKFSARPGQSIDLQIDQAGVTVVHVTLDALLGGI